MLEPIEPYRIRPDFPVLRRHVNGHPLVYLDNAATSQKPQAMIDRLRDLYTDAYAKVEEGHTLSRAATAAFEEARAKVARLLRAEEPREIVFTRGATEALNLVARAFELGRLGHGDEVIVTAMEHHSNLIPWQMACRSTGASLRIAPLTPSGDLDLDRLEAMLSDRTRIVAVTHVSNVLGAVVPVRRVVALAHARGIPVLVDGAQGAPHLPVDVQAIGCDFYAGSGHKMGGPSSIGFLYGRAAMLEALPFADGGSTMAERVTFQSVTPKPIPHKFEAGEPCFAEAVAFGAAVDYWLGLGLDCIAAYEEALTTYAVERLSDIPGVRILGAPSERVSVISFLVEGIPPRDVEKALDARGIAVRAGDLSAQPLLDLLGVPGAVRASFMFYNTNDEADALVRAVAEIAASAPRRSAA
jgi:cysteine desulfurase/selenocysteine lyase